jgi:L-ascorbate metabolism protein UlaG (beta-lactamase superfamily)
MRIRWLGHSAFLLTGESKRVVVVDDFAGARDATATVVLAADLA